MKYKHIIWDYNGTILDDAQMVLDIFNAMLEKRQLSQISMQEYREIFGFPVIECYQKAGFDFDKEPFSKLADEFMSIYARELHKCGLREGITEFIKKLNTMGCEQSILTAAKEQSVNKEIKNYELSKYISHVTGLHNNKAESKVHLGKEHLEKIKTNPKDILFIGDTTHDYLVAKEIGCDCVLLAGGHQSEVRLMAVNDLVAKDVMDIKRYL